MTDTHTHKINHIHKHFFILNFEKSWQKNNKFCLVAEELKTVTRPSSIAFPSLLACSVYVMICY